MDLLPSRSTGKRCAPSGPISTQARAGKLHGFVKTSKLKWANCYSRRETDDFARNDFFPEVTRFAKPLILVRSTRDILDLDFRPAWGKCECFEAASVLVAASLAKFCSQRRHSQRAQNRQLSAHAQ